MWKFNNVMHTNEVVGTRVTCWVHLAKMTIGIYICFFLFFINELTTGCVWKHMGGIEYLKAQLRKLQTALRICIVQGRGKEKIGTRNCKNTCRRWHARFNPQWREVMMAENDPMRMRRKEILSSVGLVGKNTSNETIPIGWKGRETDCVIYAYHCLMVDNTMGVGLKIWSKILDYLLGYVIKFLACD